MREQAPASESPQSLGIDHGNAEDVKRVTTHPMCRLVHLAPLSTNNMVPVHDSTKDLSPHDRDLATGRPNPLLRPGGGHPREAPSRACSEGHRSASPPVSSSGRCSSTVPSSRSRVPTAITGRPSGGPAVMRSLVEPCLPRLRVVTRRSSWHMFTGCRPTHPLRRTGRLYPHCCSTPPIRCCTRRARCRWGCRTRTGSEPLPARRDRSRSEN